MCLKTTVVKIPKTLLFRLSAWYVLALAVILTLLLVALFLSIGTVLDARVDEDLHEDIAEMRYLFEEDGMARLKEEIAREVSAGSHDSIFFRILNTNMEILYESDMSYWRDIETNTQAIKSIIFDREPKLETIKKSGHESDARVIYAFIGPNTILQIGESLEEKQDLMEVMLLIFALMVAVSLPIAAVIGWLMAKRAVKGMEEVSRIATSIQSGHLDGRVSVATSDEEVLRLASTFNAMLDRIRTLITELKDMTDNIAHDLRSPLARIRAVSEAALTRSDTTKPHHAAASKTIEECDRLLHMITATLELAEAETQMMNVTENPVDFSELAKDACELFEPVAEQKQIELSYGLVDDCRIQGNVHYLQRMLANLLDNALKYTPRFGSVRVDLQRDCDNVQIAIADTGVGVPDNERSRIFDRFYRCDHSRSTGGCGMGLSFAQAVVRAHGGQIDVNNGVGGGTIFTVNLPAC